MRWETGGFDWMSYASGANYERRAFFTRACGPVRELSDGGVRHPTDARSDARLPSGAHICGRRGAAADWGLLKTDAGGTATARRPDLATVVGHRPSRRGLLEDLSERD